MEEHSEKKISITRGERVEVERVIESAPQECGCYIMRNAEGKVLYIGKAKNLKSRMRQYFGASSHDDRILVRLMLPQVSTVEFVITETEKEALVLENNLIKRHRPLYNVKIRDDKTYFSLLLDLNHPYPALRLIRRRSREPLGKGKVLFGPFTSAKAARATLALVNKHFRLRDCSDREFETRKRPCLRYQMHRCPAPCVFDVPQEEYAKEVRRVKMLLEGKGELIIPELEDEMRQAAEKLEFERAARIRDLIEAVRKTIERQRVEFSRNEDVDALAIYREGEGGVAVVLRIRQGVLVEPAKYLLTIRGESTEEILSRLVVRHYSVSAPPPVVAVQSTPPDVDALSEWLSDLAKRKVQIKVPVFGKLKELLLLAERNARQHFDANRSKLDQSAMALEKIAQLLKLPEPPKVVECYDISTLGGSDAVGVAVCFVDGKPAPSRYKRYKIKNVHGQDDFAMMEEVLERRIKRGLAENDLPDLMVIDGGKGQLARAVSVIKRLAPEQNIAVVALAKERQVKDWHSTVDKYTHKPYSKPERLYLPGVKNPRPLKEGTSEGFFFVRIRDEAHRFAVEYHRLLRSKRQRASVLDSIKGVGEVRKKALLRHFGSLKRLKSATVEEISAVKGIPRTLAEQIYKTLHEELPKQT